MTAEEKKRFASNITWFNQFFKDLNLLFQKIAEALKEEPSWSKQDYYYPKYNSRPSIPPYHMMGLSAKKYAIQVFAVLDPSLFENSPYFERKPSLVIIKHSKPDKYLWVKSIGLRIIEDRNIQIESAQEDNGVLSGTIKGGEPISFHTFQVLLDEFTRGQDVEQAIQKTIVEVMRRLRPW